MTFSERLALAMSNAGVTQGGLAKSVGMAQSSVNKLLNGAKGSRKAVQIAMALNVSPEWLSSGAGEMHSSDGSISSASAQRADFYRVDVLDIQASAGPGTYLTHDFVEKVRAIEYTSEEAKALFNGRSIDNVKVISANGDSMSGTIEAGDLLFVDVSVKMFDGDGIYTFLYDDTAHVKRLQKMKDKLLVISDNKNYTPWDPIERDEMNRVVIFGKVIGSMPQTYRKHG